MTSRVCPTDCLPSSARFDLLAIKPIILSESRQDDNSGLVTIIALSAKYMACLAPVVIAVMCHEDDKRLKQPQ